MSQRGINMKQLLNKVWRTVISLAFVFAVCTTAQATDYIKDVMLIGGTSSEVNTLKITLATKGWKIITDDLNEGAGGDYIYLLYKTESRTDGLNNGFITDFLIVNTSEYPDEFTYQGRTYYLVPYDGGEHFKSVKGDLNSNANGADIHLYYTKDFFDDGKVVTGIYFNTSSTGGVGTAGSNSGYDLNLYAQGDYIYMHFDTTVCSMPFATIGEIGTSPYGVGFTTNRIYQQIYGAGELQEAALISAIAFYSWKDNPVTMDGVQIYMQQTYLDAYGVREDYIQVSENDKVFEGTVSSSGKGWFVILLDIPFNYDGKSNLVITFYCPTGNNQDYFTLNITRTDSNCCWAMKSDTVAIDPNNTSHGSISSDYRPDILFYGLTLGLSRPINLRVSHCTEEDATISWDAPYTTESIVGYSWQYKASQDSQWSSETASTNTSVTLSNLLPGTNYQFRVKSLYSSDESVYSVIKFTSAIHLPYENGFENGLDLWRVLYPHSHTEISDRRSYEGSYGFLFYNHVVGSRPPQYLISARLSDLAALSVSFQYFTDCGVVPSFQVGYSTTTDNPESFTWVDDITAIEYQWIEYNRVFPVGTSYFAIKYDMKDDSYARSLYLDSFSIEEYSDYAKPSDLIASVLTDSNATLSWTISDNSATGYAYQYKLKNSSEWSTESVVPDKSVTINGLSPNTDYAFRVKAIYSGGNTSNYSVLHFTTEGPTVSLPYWESFENGLGSWRILNGVTSGLYNNYARIGATSFRFNNHDGSVQYLMSPQLSGNSGVVVSFYCKNYTEGSTSYPAYYKVGFSTSTKEISSFVWGEEIKCSSLEWEHYAGVAPVGTKYISVQFVKGMILFLDDFYFTINQEQITAKKVEFLGSEKYVATFFDRNNHYRLPEGAVAYTAELDGTEVVFVRLGDGESRDIPAGTPVIVVADKESSETDETKMIDIAPLVSTSVTARPGNILQASDTDIDVTDGKVGGKTVYVVGVKNGVLGLYKFTGSVIPAGKAYYLAD